MCRRASIAPIIGAELTLSNGLAQLFVGTVVLLAQNLQGYGNLRRLIVRLQAAPDHEATLLVVFP